MHRLGLRAINNGRNGKGCVVVFSAGNTANRINSDNGFIGFPATISEVITVGASNRNDEVANYSPNSMVSNNIFLDITAPSHHAYPYQISSEGFEVWSTDISGTTYGYNLGTSDPEAGDVNGNYTADFGGTSAACPQVSAAVGLLLSVSPNLTFQQVADLLTSTADKVGSYNYNAVTSKPGFSLELGYGRLNVETLLEPQIVTVMQENEVGVQFGMIDHWENSQWADEPSGHTYDFQVGNTEYFQAETTISQNEKFNNWNNNLSY